MSTLVHISIKHVSVTFLFSKGKGSREPKAQRVGAYPGFLNEGGE